MKPGRPEASILQTYRDLHLGSNPSFVERNLEVAHRLGLRFEKRFWRLVLCLEQRVPLGRSYDLYCDRASYLLQEEERCKLHLNRATDRDSRRQVTARLLCLGEIEPAVKLLLETEPAEESFLADQLLACLISTTSNTGT